MDQLTLNWGPPVDIRIGNGPLATERMLLEDIEALLEELGETVLKRPLLVVVPSRSLRLHVIERLLSTRKRALAGVECRTHRSLAAMILEATGMPTRYEPDRVALFARRFSRQETALATALDHLAEGYKPVVSAVSDLLDAGLDSAHREALEDTLEEDGSHVATKADIARARAIVGVATRTVVAMKNVELDRASTLLAKATEIVRFRSPRPVSAVCVYGYSDATGVATDFLEGLLKTYGGRLYLDQPPDPAYPDRMDVGVRFSRRFSERFGHRTQSRVSIPSAPSSVEMFKALGADAEVLEVATRIRALLDGGRTAERIGVVARSLTPYRDSLRTQLARLGVPFSGVGSKGPSAPPAYRVRALLDLLRLAGRTPIERWLEARSPSSLAAADFDVRLALHTLGAGRIEEAALLSIPRAAPHGSVRLPFVNGLALTEPREDDVERKPYARRRRLEARTLERETELARAVIRLLDGGREPLAADRRLEQLEALLTLELGWAADEPVVDELLLRARQAVEGLPSDFLLDLDEWIEFLETAWDEVGKTDLGGSGGGVQVLDVTEARGRTFDQLFIIGLNRGTFPRTVHEDAMLPDSLRRVLARSGHGVLPDLPLKLDGVSEERLLFAQLLAASPSVTLSWQEVDDEHTFKTPSPLVERLRSSSARHDRLSSWKTPPTAQSPFSVGSPEKDCRPRSAYENAVLAGIFGDRERHRFRDLLTVALEESRRWDGEITDAKAVAGARLRILSEVDPPRGTAPGESTHRRLGPYLGLIGPAVHPQDPRRQRHVYVTRLENVAKCPWQTFLRKVLGVEPLPDPLEVLPAMEPRLLGNLTHRVLERIGRRALGEPPESLDDARSLPGADIPWPSAEELQNLLRDCAAQLAVDEGIALPGFDRVLAYFGASYVERARECDWPEGRSRHPGLAVEYPSRLGWPGSNLDIAFRADRLDRGDTGLIFSDYKTGRKVFGQDRATAAALSAAVAAGESLQGVAYALAGGEDGDRGRYLFVNPELDADSREVLVSPDDTALVVAFTRAVNATLEAWTRGVFFPRLSQARENREPRLCSMCEVAEACLRGDSGIRGRLRDLNDAARQAGEEEPPGDPSEPVLHTLWMLPESGKGR